MDYDALILAGGRSARLGGVPKSGLFFDGESLLDRAIAAARGALRIVVVGPGVPTPPDVLHTREDPPFSGPAAAIDAGLAALSANRQPASFTLVLACDMPLVNLAVPALLAAARDEAKKRTAHFDGIGAISPDGRHQPLAAVYSTDALVRNAAVMAASGQLTNGSVRSLLANLDVVPVPVPAGSTDDVDTWADAQVLGVTRTAAHNRSGSQQPDDATLEADREDARPDS